MRQVVRLKHAARGWRPPHADLDDSNLALLSQRCSQEGSKVSIKVTRGSCSDPNVDVTYQGILPMNAPLTTAHHTTGRGMRNWPSKSHTGMVERFTTAFVPCHGLSYQGNRKFARTVVVEPISTKINGVRGE